ncbi:MAG: DNA polymerase-2, partial [Candidatus Latescibacterota bacterium]
MEEQERDEGVRAFLLHVFHRQHKGRDVIHAVGRLENGATFGLMDQRAKPALYVRAVDGDVLRDELSNERAELVEVPYSTLDGAQVVRVECHRVGGLRRLAKRLEERGVRTYEADVNFALHYFMERGLRGSVRLRGAWQQGQGVERVYVDPVIEPITWQPVLSMLVLDIETAPDASEVYAVSLVGGLAGGES